METREDLVFELNQDKLQQEREAARKINKTLWHYKIVNKEGKEDDQKHGPFEQAQLAEWNVKGFFKETESIKCLFAKVESSYGGDGQWVSLDQTGF